MEFAEKHLKLCGKNGFVNQYVLFNVRLAPKFKRFSKKTLNDFRLY